MGLGIAMVGQSEGIPALTVLGLGGALLHVVNHATFKALLFLAAGSVIHATGTREIDLMGGVARRLPFSSLFFLLGAVAICGLPPLNGFVSEILVYLGAFSSIRSYQGMAGALPAVAAPALALIGALAVACFVKVYGVAFLGVPRSVEHAGGHEAPAVMLWPMALLCAVCLLIGVFPVAVGLPLNNAIAAYQGTLAVTGIQTLAPLGPLSILGVSLLALAALVRLVVWRRERVLPRDVSSTWGCGYLKPTPRMQYSASSFGSMLVNCFRGVLLPEVHRKEVSGIFPAAASHSSHVPEAVLERVYLPFLDYLYRKSGVIRRMQHGRLNIYIFYSFMTLVLLLVLTM
jgi:hydrogenase-4 component B